MAFTKKSTFGTRLNLMRRVFELKQFTFTLSGTFRTILLPDPRRVWVKFGADGTTSFSWQMRIRGSQLATGLHMQTTGVNSETFSVEESFSFCQQGVEGMAGGAFVLQVIECIYTGG